MSFKSEFYRLHLQVVHTNLRNTVTNFWRKFDFSRLIFTQEMSQNQVDFIRFILNELKVF